MNIYKQKLNLILIGATWMQIDKQKELSLYNQKKSENSFFSILLKQSQYSS